MPLPHTLVVGGGIGGLTAAAALARRGVPVRVVEQAPAFAPIGAGITIQANATAVLRALGIELPAKDVVPIGSVELVDADGRVLTGADPDAVLADPPSMNIHRSDLHAALIAACGDVPLETDRRVARIEPGDDAVTVHFEDGTSEPCELLVGADGIHSRVRESLTGEAAEDTRYSGQTCWRFALEAPDLVPEVTTEHWSPGRRAGMVPLSRGRIYVYLVLSAPRGTPEPGSDAPAVLKRHFGGISPGLDAVLDRLDASVPVNHADLCDRPRVDFGRGRVVLLGDAAHPMTPNTGQGAGTAIEDAGALSLLVPRHAEALDGLVPALDARRRKRVTSTLRLSWRIGRVAHWRHPLARRVRDALLRAMPAESTNRQAEKLWEPGIALAAEIQAESR